MDGKLIASFKGLNGILFKGPVILQSDGVYLFKNTNTEDDLYFRLKKSPFGWVFAGGPQSFKVPQEFIDAVGSQIDNMGNEK